MKKFRFAIMGAAKIANKFCEAVVQLGNCEVAAVASKSSEKAADFAKSHNIPASYGDYEEMLQKEKPDAVYIAVTPHDHYRLTMLCLDHKVPVLCEKAAYRTAKEAQTVFDRSKEEGVFVMEATWSRFLPTNKKVREWLDAGAIGKLTYADAAIGFHAPEDPENRYLNPALGGGAALDVTIYAYEVPRLFIDEDLTVKSVEVLRGATGVDMTEHITLKGENVIFSLTTSFAVKLQENMVLYGEKGKIVVPRPHCAQEAFLYNENGECVEHYTDESGRNGFTYEIQETMDCVNRGEIESKIVPHALTLDCAELFDLIQEQ